MNEKRLIEGLEQLSVEQLSEKYAKASQEHLKCQSDAKVSVKMSKDPEDVISSGALYFIEQLDAAKNRKELLSSILKAKITHLGSASKKTYNILNVK
jgi:hypothetical protein